MKALNPMGEDKTHRQATLFTSSSDVLTLSNRQAAKQIEGYQGLGNDRLH